MTKLLSRGDELICNLQNALYLFRTPSNLWRRACAISVLVSNKRQINGAISDYLQLVRDSNMDWRCHALKCPSVCQLLFRWVSATHWSYVFRALTHRFLSVWPGVFRFTWQVPKWFFREVVNLMMRCPWQHKAKRETCAHPWYVQFHTYLISCIIWWRHHIQRCENYWPFLWGIHGQLWISLTKGQQCDLRCFCVTKQI